MRSICAYKIKNCQYICVFFKFKISLNPFQSVQNESVLQIERAFLQDVTRSLWVRLLNDPSNIMTSSPHLFASLMLRIPAPCPLRPSSQKPQRPRHTWAAAGPPPAAPNVPGLLWDLRSQPIRRRIHAQLREERQCGDQQAGFICCKLIIRLSAQNPRCMQIHSHNGKSCN